MKNIYEKILNFPKLILIFFSFLILISFFFTKDFKLDASADTLLLENDPDLNYLRKINKRYGSEEFFIITYTSKEKLSKNNLRPFQKLISEINLMPWVSKTISIMNAPLLQSSNEPLLDRVKNLKYITNKNINFDRAISELKNSPVYKDLIISSDGKTFGVVVYLKDNIKYLNLMEEKVKILNKKNINTDLLNEINSNLEKQKIIQSKNISNYNKEIKSTIKSYKKYADIRLSGIPMIADDMIGFIKKDILIFGICVFLFIVITLRYIFKDIKWVIFPLLSCIVSISIMTGILGFLSWKVTVISSNFIALMLILTMSMNIHYLVRYMQMNEGDLSFVDVNNLIKKTSGVMFYPIFYAVLTTICAFVSLVFSEIKPVIDFGWMMTIGLIISLTTTFLLLPSLIIIFKPTIPSSIKDIESKSLNKLNQVTFFPVLVFFSVIGIVCFSFYGLSKLKVENSFINYFDNDTEIYKGMKHIDEKLGGTTPLEIILKFKTSSNQNDESFLGENNESDNFLGENKENSFLGTEDQKEDISKYWFSNNKVSKIIDIHQYLENRPEIGKVLSFYSILQIAEQLNNNKKLGSLEMGVLYDKLPENIKDQIIKPYISIDNNEARISMRIKDSLKDLRRKELLENINKDLSEKFALKQNDYQIAGVLVIFNNLLQSLFKSQIKSLGFVMIGIFLMFWFLFRSLKLSCIGIIPNLIAALFILGFIGFLNIPLDMMTITIAAITIGIAVDNSIHYIYRYKKEFSISNDKNKAVEICHQTVGKAILSTSVTIIFGFSILILSNFNPTIYFGLFTGLAMLTALILVLTLLPILLKIFINN